METFLKADIFFVVTTSAVVFIAVAVLIAFIYIIILLRHLSKLMYRIRLEGEEIVDDMRAVRNGVESSGTKIQEVFAWIGRIVMRIITYDRR